MRTGICRTRFLCRVANDETAAGIARVRYSADAPGNGIPVFGGAVGCGGGVSGGEV